jgi:uncharacterized protein DUF5985
MATVVYALCAATSLLCAVLLARGYRRSRARLLFWSAWCFAFLAANNVLLVVDRLIWTSADLGDLRTATGLAGLLLLLYGLIFDLERAPGR